MNSNESQSASPKPKINWRAGYAMGAFLTLVVVAIGWVGQTPAWGWPILLAPLAFGFWIAHRILRAREKQQQ